MKSSGGVFASVVLIAAAGTAAAQKLPQGRHQPTRERAYDLQHYRAELELDFERRAVSGRATIELEPLVEVDQVSFDAYALEVESVVVDDGQAVGFTNDGRSLRVELPAPRAAGEPLALVVSYSAAPRAGIYFQAEPESPGLFVVHTYGEGGLHANWLPIYNDVNDKFTTEMLVTVPPPYIAVSNGSLIGRSEGADGRITYHWRQDRPHSNYLISLYVGDFERGELEPALGRIPLAYWVPRGRLAEGAWAFRNTTRMVEFFSALLGRDYPWARYDQVAVPDYAIGAMEHTGVTGHRASVLRLPGEGPDDFGGPDFDDYHTDWTAEATIAHELAHHWFGNDLTCRNLGHIWLNESFASYLMMLWAEELLGEDQLLFDLDLARRHYFEYVATEHEIRPLEYAYFDSPDDIYNTEHTYLKGAAVLHMLRRILGDGPFFGVLEHYLDKHEAGNVESRDLAIAIEEATGRNLAWFFDDWITGAGHPRFEIGYRFFEEQGVIDLEIRQVQPLVEGQGYFKLPLGVTVATAAGSRQETVWVEGEEHHFVLAAEGKPLMVSVDGEGSLVAEIEFEKELDELVYQVGHDALGGRLRAVRQLARRFPHRQRTLEVLEELLTGEGVFWGLRAEAARLLGEVRTPSAEALIPAALASGDYRVRKAAVLALPRFGTPSAGELLRGVIRDDPHGDVVGTAIVALAEADPETPADVFEQQLARDAWYDEIRIATLAALEEMGRPELLHLVRPRVAPPHNQEVRKAALGAWAAAAPADPELHRLLLAAAQTPPYALQKFAIEKLGELSVVAAEPVLVGLAEEDRDPNLTALAGEALESIRRLAQR